MRRYAVCFCCIFLLILTAPTKNVLSAGQQVSELESLQQAAEQGDANAQFRLGLMYVDGRGVPKDESKAVEWFQKATDQGHADAQAYLNRMQANKDSITYWRTVEERYRKAAEQGNANAQFQLGKMYATGQGVPKDLHKAVEWYQKAADQGFEDAQFQLGKMYATGEGVPKDLHKAAEWFLKAVNHSHYLFLIFILIFPVLILAFIAKSKGIDFILSYVKDILKFLFAIFIVLIMLSSWLGSLIAIFFIYRLFGVHSCEKTKKCLFCEKLIESKSSVCSFCRKDQSEKEYANLSNFVPPQQEEYYILENSIVLPEELKKCPFCEKVIARDDSVCRFCRKDPSEQKNVKSIDYTPAQQEDYQADEKPFLQFLFPIFIFFMMFIFFIISIGALGFFISIIILAVFGIYRLFRFCMKDQSEQEDYDVFGNRIVLPEELKKCPFCKKPIEREASVCRFCRKDQPEQKKAKLDSG